ncbi:MAG: ATP-binding protein, partial [Thermodesulfovibrio sp.]|nr:ATP-binding protein [Thermodesulfovibrio sp.]
MTIKPWTQVVKLHPDVESEETAIATYAIDLGALIEKDPNVPPTYRDAYSFFRATHLTSDMKFIIEEVYERLSGKDGNRVLQLQSPFGGGKSHTLATLYYALRSRKELEQSFPEMKLPRIENVRVAVFDGEKFDALNGKNIEDKTIRTIWGYIAWQLGNYALLEEQDQKRVAPGGDLIKRLLGDEPVFIMLDEVSRYLEKSMAVTIGESTLYRQVLDFMQTLTTEVSGSKYACLIYSLQASARESFGNIEILETLDHLTSRVDAKREPITGDEIFSVLRKRLLSEPPPEDIANKVADIYVDTIKKNILSYVPSDSERREMEERIIKYRERFLMAYPFHPALIDLMRERWASIPDFQRTRGALRFLAVVLRALKNRNVHDYLVGATEIPIEDATVRRVFLSEVGQREPYQAVLEADFIGTNATIKRIDKTFADAKSPATKIATAILMFSFGGLPKKEGKEGETLPPGITEHDLMFASISPYLDSTMIKAVLKEILGKCLYVHYDGARYAFKTTPNINKLLEDEADGISDTEIKDEIKKFLEAELGGKPAIIWQSQSKNIPDKEPVFRIAYLPFDFVYKSKTEQEKLGLELLIQFGDRPRIYKNGLALAIPDKDQVEPLRRAIRYLIAIDRVRGKKKSLNLTEEQLEQLKEREKTEKASKDSALRYLYSKVWLLKLENGNPIIEFVEIGGRAIQSTNIHDRLMELLIRVTPPKVFESLTPKKLLDFIKDKGIETKIIVDTFFSSPEFPRVVDENVIKKAIARGIKEGLFGLTNKEHVQKKDEEVLFPKEKVTLNKEINIDEIDIDSGYIVNIDKVQTIAEVSEEIKPPPPSPPPPLQQFTEQKKITYVNYELKVNRQQLYRCFKAFENIIEKSGKISIKVEANFEEAVDPTW